jgi:hypothetical protein
VENFTSSHVSLSRDDFEVVLKRAAEAGARKALSDIGLHDECAATDVREIRSLLDSWRDAKKTALQSVVSLLTKGAMIALAIGLWYQVKNKV